MTFSTVWNNLIGREERITELSRKLSRTVESIDNSVPDNKTSLIFVVKEFAWEIGDFSLKEEAVIQSNDGVVLITDLSVDVFLLDGGVRKPSARDREKGHVVGASLFDFEWNLKLGASGNMYGQDGQGGLCMLSRVSLGNPAFQKSLVLRNPLRIEKGEGLHMLLKPTVNESETGSYIASVACAGYKLLGE